MRILQTTLFMLAAAVFGQAHAGFENVTMAVGEQRTVPQWFTPGGALVGEYNWEWHENRLPDFLYVNGVGMTFGGAEIVDATKSGFVLGYQGSPYSEGRHFVWRNGVQTFLGTAGFKGTDALHVQESGLIAGEVYDEPWESSPRRVAVWDANHPEQPVFVAPWPSRIVRTGWPDYSDVSASGEVLFNAKVGVGGFERNRPFVWKDGRLYSPAAGIDLSTFPSPTPPHLYAERIPNDYGWLIRVRSAEEGRSVSQLFVRYEGKVQALFPPVYGHKTILGRDNLRYAVSIGGVTYYRNGWILHWHKGKMLNLSRLAGLGQIDDIYRYYQPFWGGPRGVFFQHPDGNHIYRYNGRIIKTRPGRTYSVGPIPAPHPSLAFGTLEGSVGDWDTGDPYSEDAHALASFEAVSHFMPLAGTHRSWVLSNNADEAVGVCETDAGLRAFVYRRGRWRDLGVQPEFPFSNAKKMVIAEDGRIAMNVVLEGEEYGATYLYTEDLAALPDAYSAVSERTLTIDPDLGVLPNDHGLGELSATLSEGPKHGSLVLEEDGSFEYTPEPGFVGEDSFSYRASDGKSVTEPATVTIDVVAHNAPPVASASDLTVRVEREGEGGPWTIFATMGSATDANDPPETLTLEWWQNGKLYAVGPKLAGNATLGSYPFTFVVRDPHGAESKVDITVKIADPEPPVFTWYPERLSTYATSPAGAAISYDDFEVRDDLDEDPSVRYSRPSGALFPIGKSILRAVATDWGGNKATAIVPVHVSYDCAGLQEPAEGSSVRVGDKVAVSFTLQGVSAAIKDAAATLWAKREGLYAPVKVGSFTYDGASGRYRLVWDTAGYKLGRYDLRLDLGDGAIHRTKVVLVK